MKKSNESSGFGQRMSDLEGIKISKKAKSPSVPDGWKVQRNKKDHLAGQHDKQSAPETDDSEV